MNVTARGSRDRSLALLLAAALLGVVIGALLVSRGTGPDVAHAGPGVAQLDHFQCYSAKFTPNTPIGDPITLRDQFAPKRIKHRVERPRFFCNPVQKVHDGTTYPIVNRNNHLTAYRLTGRTPRRKLQITNQFQKPPTNGRPNLVLNPGTAANPSRPLILAPTRKTPHEEPKGIDHFKCYSVRPLPRSTVDQPVLLTDQFWTRDAKVMRARLLCNPAKKTHNGIVVPITNRKDHLVCYSITRARFPSGQEPTRGIYNQFAKHKMTALVANMLCVPSEKKVL